MASLSRGRGVERILAKLKASVENGQYYEAHQMYRTLYFRYSSQKQYPELLELLFSGSLDLLLHKQNGSGADLAMLFVDVLTKANVEVSEEILEKICRLHSLIWADTPERSSLLTTSIQWSRGVCREHKVGHPRLHQLVAITFWKEKNYSQSSFHFLRSMDGEGCASMLVEYHMSSGYSSEVDLFVAQAVFQYLCLRNKVTANLVFFTYAERHPNINHGPPFLMPLLNFVWFLLLTIESGKLTVFTVLCEQYQNAIRRDPAYTEYLDKIGQLFFGLPPPKPRHNNMFGNLLQSIFSGIEDDSEDESLGSSSCQQLQSEELD